MNREKQLNIFRAQTENLREINKTWKHVQRTINQDLVCDNHTSALIHTKLLALVFCAWSEANFSKLIHTPHGFESDEILQIKDLAKTNIVDGWEKCLELGLLRVSKTSKSNYKPNIKQSVEKLISEYIQEPRVIRNKIAHGQWKNALNRENNDINKALSEEIDNINVVQLNIWRDAHIGLSNIIKVLIESPDRAFHRDYWCEISNINDHLNKTKSWNLDDKIKQLKMKRSKKYIRKRKSANKHPCS